MENFTNEISSFFRRYAYAFKGAIILFLMLLLLIPASLLENLIWERSSRQADVTKEVGSRWGAEQCITGPVLAIPYGKTGNYAYLLPETLKINGELLPEQLHQGIFNVAVYNAKLQLSGTFNSRELAASSDSLEWAKSVLLIGISDLHGIDNQVQMMWNGKSYLFNPGMVNNDLFLGSIQAPVSIAGGDSSALGGNFSLELGLKGSGRISFSPVGKTTIAGINSSWTSPAFDGAFPPKDRRVDDKGFAATWQVQHLNRDYPQSWIGKRYNIHSGDFGVRLFTPVESYQKSTRAVKYAILIIGLTFFVFYFIELSQHRAFHPLQYALIGLALCIFYSLLISISEQINFLMAYIIASVLTIGLIIAFTAAAFKSGRIAAVIGATLTLLYGFIYVIVSAEDQALLMGSLGLFIILALIMYFSNSIKWDKLGQKNNTIN